MSVNEYLVEEVKTLCLDNGVLLQNAVETDDAAHHGNVPLSEELPAQLDQLEQDRAACVLLLTGNHS